jgi:hypothetical protein
MRMKHFFFIVQAVLLLSFWFDLQAITVTFNKPSDKEFALEYSVLVGNEEWRTCQTTLVRGKKVVKYTFPNNFDSRMGLLIYHDHRGGAYIKGENISDGYIYTIAEKESLIYTLCHGVFKPRNLLKVTNNKGNSIGTYPKNFFTFVQIISNFKKAIEILKKTQRDLFDREFFYKKNKWGELEFAFFEGDDFFDWENITKMAVFLKVYFGSPVFMTPLKASLGLVGWIKL